MFLIGDDIGGGMYGGGKAAKLTDEDGPRIEEK